MSSAATQLLSVALDHHRAGRLAEAEPLYRQVLAADSRQPDAWHLLGALCLQAGRAGEAVEPLRQAIALVPDNADYHSHLGAAYGTLGEHAASVAALRRAAELAPTTASIHYNLGTALRNAGEIAQSAISFRQAIQLNPAATEAYYNLGNSLRELGQLTDAEAMYRAALRLRPGYLKALVNLGNVLRDQERLDEAIEVLRHAVALDPNYASGHLNLGTVLRDAGQFDAAIASLRTAVELQPAMAEAHNNLGTALQALARFDEAMECYETALRYNPELADAHFSRASHRLRLGDLAGGFEEYEWRWRCKSYSTRRFDRPQWDGSPLAGRTIFLHAEQGLGDAMQFVRYAADAQARGGRVVFECPPALMGLLETRSWIDQLVPAGSPPPEHDLHCPLMSLPGVLGLTIDNLDRGAYLAAEPERIARWADRLANLDGFRVGVCWRGNPQYLFDRQRSFALAELAPVAQVAGVRLVSLQKGRGTQEIATCGFPVMELGDELDRDAPFLDTAAVIKNLDLVITADTSVAHLAGGLGVPTWIALTAHNEWRWFMERDDSPWYASVRLFRQTKLDAWRDVFERMADAMPRENAARED